MVVRGDFRFRSRQQPSFCASNTTTTTTFTPVLQTSRPAVDAHSSAFPPKSLIKGRRSVSGSGRLLPPLSATTG